VSWERTPRNLELRRRAQRDLVGAKLRAHPELLAICRENLDRWESLGSWPQAHIDAWRQLLDAGLPAVLEVLEGRDETVGWLRRCAPTPGVLTEAERLDFLRVWRPPD
jgi:hypothetical protein